MRLRALLGLSLLALVIAPAALRAHPDDPKIRDKQPVYTGPGWTADGGTAAPPFPASGVELRAWLTCPQLQASATSANVVWGYVSPSSREYALVGLSNGTAIVEVTNPASPTVVDFIAGPDSLWRDIRTYENYAYAVSEGGSGIQVIDLANIDAGDATLVRTVTTGGTTATHTLMVNPVSGYLYRAGGGSNGIRIYNLEPDPSNPQFVASWGSRYVHEVTPISYTSGPLAGKEYAYCCAGFNGGFDDTGLTILDVTNKASISLVKQTYYPNPAFSHQIWLSPDLHYAYLNDELDEDGALPTTTHIFNVADPANTSYVGSFTNGNPAIGHNLYTKDNLIFAANYRAGLRVFDATNPTSPTEVAFFDTYPANDSPEFNSLWLVHPYLPSGTILGSDIEQGLFVWRLTFGQLDFSYPDGRPATLHPAGETIAVDITAQNGTLNPATAQLHYDAGAGYLSVPLTPLGGDSFAASFPAIACGSTVQYYFSAETTEGVLVNDPSAAPFSTYSALVLLNQQTGFSDSMETNLGWSVGGTGDNATTGLWVRVDPVGTAAQPEDDNPAGTGTRCWITGNGAVGGGLGDADVDGGQTTLTSPTLDATGGDDVLIEYYRWYSNDLGSEPGTDSMPVQISNNDGASWVALESVTENAGVWVHKTFRIADYVAPTNQVRIRFIARDLAGGSIVEAGVDDVRIIRVICEPPIGDLTCDGAVDSFDIGAFVLALTDAAGYQTAYPDCDRMLADINGDGVVDSFDIAGFVASLTGG